MMEQLGNEPIPEEIPLEYGDFPNIVQEAMQIFSILPDVYEGFSATYMGKDYTILPYLMDTIFAVNNPQQTMQILLMIASIVMNNRVAEQIARDRKAKHKKK